VWDQDAACHLLDGGHLDGVVTDVAVPEPLSERQRLTHATGAAGRETFGMTGAPGARGHAFGATLGLAPAVA
jgi:hypothetical protein